MKKIITGMCVVAGLFFLPACNWLSGEKKVEKPRVRLVNVLDKEYFDDAHIQGADDVASLNLPWTSEEDFKKATGAWEKDIPVVTYCADYMCTASHDAAKALMDAGFEKVFVYSGGTAEWSQLSKNDPSYKLVGPAKQEYLSLENKKKGHATENIKEIDAQELQKMIK